MTVADVTRELVWSRSANAGGARGDALGLISDTGHLELTVREGSVASVLGLGPGSPVAIRYRVAGRVERSLREARSS